MQPLKTPIGIFDSGYGGLTVLKEIVKELPQYDYVYLGDNARAPYGTRSFDTVYEYTLQCVKQLFRMNCELIILACNTASAKALRNIQQKDLPLISPAKRVLGVIRPTAEIVHEYTRSGHVGIFGTNGTVLSNSYPIEISKLHPELMVQQEACPIWVSLVENGETEEAGTDFFVKKHIDRLLEKDPKIDAVILGCTHYPLLLHKIRKYMPEGITILTQGEIVARSLADYLQRHREIEGKCSRNGTIEFYTTDQPADFDEAASRFFGRTVHSRHLELVNN